MLTPEMKFYTSMVRGALREIGLKTRGQSIANFTKLAMRHEASSEILWQKIFALHPGAASHIFFPSGLKDRPDIIIHIQKIPVEELCREGVLDLGELDLIARGIREEEIENLKILFELNKLCPENYLLLSQIGKARRGGEAREQLRFDLGQLMSKLPELRGRLSAVNKPYRRAVVALLDRAESEHKKNNPSAANTCLVAALKHLEAKVDEVEAGRLKARGGAKERIARIAMESAENLGLKDFGIKRLPGGRWFAPKKGWIKTGDISLKIKQEQEIKDDSALVRRFEHIVESIEQRMEKNRKNIEALNHATEILKGSLEKLKTDPSHKIEDGERASIKSMIFSPLLDCKRAIKRRKHLEADWLLTTLNFIDTSLFKQAISVIEMVIDHLEDINIELAGQKVYYEKQAQVVLNEFLPLVEKEHIRGGITWAIRQLSILKPDEQERIKALGGWIKHKAIPEVAELISPDLKTPKECLDNAAKSLWRAVSWSQEKQALMEKLGPNADKVAIGKINAARNIVKAAKWLIVADWCIDRGYGGKVDERAFKQILKRRIGDKHMKLLMEIEEKILGKGAGEGKKDLLPF